MRQPDETLSAGENGQPLSDVSRPIGEQRPVHEGAQTIGETSDGPVHSRSVRDPGTRGMLSGSVSDISRGPMTESRAMTGGGSVTEASAGAVKHDIDVPLGERISQPLRELQPLQEQMRQVRQQAAIEAARKAAEPVAGDTIDDGGAADDGSAAAADLDALPLDYWEPMPRTPPAAAPPASDTEEPGSDDAADAP